MLTDTCGMLGFRISATDGLIGTVRDHLAEDSTWVIRYLTVDTSVWMMGRRVVISPVSVTSVDRRLRIVSTNLSRAQIMNAPGIDVHPTISREHEMLLAEYFGWPHYWHEPAGMDAVARLEVLCRGRPSTGKSCLLSLRDTLGYHIEAVDGHAGHVDNFIFKDDDWMVRYLLADTRNWLPGRHVLLAPQWITKMDWCARKLFVSLNRREIRSSPSYRPAHMHDVALEALASGRREPEMSE